MKVLTKDQNAIIEYLDDKIKGDEPINDIGVIITKSLIQLGLLDVILSGESSDEFCNIVIMQFVNKMTEIMGEEGLSKLMDTAFDNAVEVE